MEKINWKIPPRRQCQLLLLSSLIPYSCSKLRLFNGTIRILQPENTKQLEKIPSPLSYGTRLYCKHSDNVRFRTLSSSFPGVIFTYFAPFPLSSHYMLIFPFSYAVVYRSYL